MLESCEFPKLSAKYDHALREAVSFVLKAFNPIGIIASGTIVRGNPDATSDLDIWVVHLEPMRQRIQKFFSAVPAEIFVNPPWVIENYFAQDQLNARPISAHMLATGFVILATDPVIAELRQKAEWLLTQPPELTPEAITRARYGAATRFEDATDISARNPVAASQILSQAVFDMVRFAFMNAQRFIPRDKDLLAEFGLLNPDVAMKVREFIETSSHDERLRLATEVADNILGVRGFFEWSSSPEVKPKPGSKVL